MENTILIGRKISNKKKIILAWVLVILLVASYCIYIIAGYSKYKNYQTKCVSLLKLSDIVGDLDMPEDEDEFIDAWYRKLSPNYRVFSGGYISEEMAAKFNKAYEDMRSAARKLFDTVDYPIKWQPAYVLDYHNIVQYGLGQFMFTDNRWNDETIINIVFFSIVAVCFLLTFVTQIISKKNSKQMITVDNSGVQYSFGKKHTTIEASRISAVVKKPYHGVLITSPGKKIAVSMLENQIEIVDRITDMINDEKRLSVSDRPAEMKTGTAAQQFKEWKELLDSGVITEEEFEEKKKSLLL